MMNMEQEITKRINEALEIEVEVKHVSITKNNGIVHDGFTVRKKDEKVAPTIYYDKNDSDYEIVERIVNCYIHNVSAGEDTNSISETLDSVLKNKDVLYTNVIPCVVNNDNVERFDREGIIHDSFLDMEIIYRIRISINDGTGTIILKQGLIDAYDIDMNLVRENAMKNLRNNIKIDSMRNTLIGFGEAAGKDVSELIEHEFDNNMYLISTHDMYYGASAIMLEDVLKDMHDKFGTDEIYILPSSIHEIIVLPKDNEEDEEEDVQAFKNMVMTINATELSPEDKLTDSVYIHRADGLMTVV